MKKFCTSAEQCGSTLTSQVFHAWDWYCIHKFIFASDKVSPGRCECGASWKFAAFRWATMISLAIHSWTWLNASRREKKIPTANTIANFSCISIPSVRWFCAHHMHNWMSATLQLRRQPTPGGTFPNWLLLLLLTVSRRRHFSPVQFDESLLPMMATLTLALRIEWRGGGFKFMHFHKYFSSAHRAVDLLHAHPCILYR